MMEEGQESQEGQEGQERQESQEDCCLIQEQEKGHDQKQSDISCGRDISASSGVVGEKLAPFNPTDRAAIHIALQMLQIAPFDVIYDLGCGDARFLVEV